MTDIVERLRADRGAGNEHWQDVLEAADEITALRSEIERLRAALADVMRHPDGMLLADIIDRKPGLESLRALFRECLKESIKPLPSC